MTHQMLNWVELNNEPRRRNILSIVKTIWRTSPRIRADKAISRQNKHIIFDICVINSSDTVSIKTSHGTWENWWCESRSCLCSYWPVLNCSEKYAVDTCSWVLTSYLFSFFSLKISHFRVTRCCTNMI